MELEPGRDAGALKNYYRLGRRLLACLLLPLAAGFYFTESWVMATALLYMIWLGSSSICARAMGDLVIHSAANGKKRWLAFGPVGQNQA